MRTSNLTEREISGIKIITRGQTQLAQVKRAITQTVVAKKREEVRDDLRAALVDTLRPRISIFMETVFFFFARSCRTLCAATVVLPLSRDTAPVFPSTLYSYISDAEANYHLQGLKCNCLLVLFQVCAVLQEALQGCSTVSTDFRQDGLVHAVQQGG